MSPDQPKTEMDDAWRCIGLHLQPRHVFKLMQTSKAIRRCVDNDEYWERAALHMQWVEHFRLRGIKAPCVSLTGLSCIAQGGYYAAMNRSVETIRACLSARWRELLYVRLDHDPQPDEHMTLRQLNVLMAVSLDPENMYGEGITAGDKLFVMGFSQRLS